jgi:O-acetyl-ADP-ribose deacetylase
MTFVSLVEGDIVDQTTDAIVNAANQELVPGGGVDGAITREAGRQAFAEREELIATLGTPPLPTGEAVATGGGDLRARWIIFTAGPIYSGNESDAALLARCHGSVLRVADRVGARSVAFPAISTGVFGYPPAEAADVATSTVMKAQTHVDEVRFVLFGRDLFDVFLAATEHNAAALGWVKDADLWRPA